MKRKLLALGLTVALTLSMSFTALCASPGSNTSPGKSKPSSSDSSDSAPEKPKEATIENAAPGGKVDPKVVKVAIVGADGKVANVSFSNVVDSAKTAITSASAESPAQTVVTVQALMTTAPTPFFAQTIEALAAAKGSEMVINDCGTVKTVAVAADAFGNNIASAGVIKNVTAGALILLMSVNADGQVEYVEGVVDPVTGAVVGAFKGVPRAITVLVLA